MLILITGGSGSGKSAFAEAQIVKLGSGRRIYAATMMSLGAESKWRIARHRQMRKDKGFQTLECPTDIASLPVEPNDIVLLECLSNLTANEMFAGEVKERSVVKAKILADLRQLRDSVSHLCVVTNEIFSDGICYDRDTQAYQQTLGEINQQLARWADQVIEVVGGIPVWLKREGGTGEECT